MGSGKKCLEDVFLQNKKGICYRRSFGPRSGQQGGFRDELVGILTDEKFHALITDPIGLESDDDEDV